MKPYFCTIAAIGLALACVNPVRAADLHVPAGHATIQAAVDAAASGDTIHIAPGVYAEQIIIDGKNLTLIGKPGAVLRAFPGMSIFLPGFENRRVCLLGIYQSEVTVSGLTFEGEHVADGNTTSIGGLFFLGASGRVENCRFHGFRGSTLGYNAFCRGLLVVNPTTLNTGVVNVEVHRNVFSDNVNSIVITGDFPMPGHTPDRTLLRTTFVVNDNTVVGNGPDATGFQSGILIDSGAAGEIKRNLISDHSCVMPGATEPAVALNASDFYGWGRGLTMEALQPLHLEGNIFRDNQYHCYLGPADDSVVVNNSFQGTAPGILPTGLGISGDKVSVTSNRFSDMPLGIQLYGQDPDFGTRLGIATEAVLSSNGFCNVTANYDFQSLATYDAQDTLNCPEPVLDVRAVQLSWPYSYEGYSVETASAVTGPWTGSSGGVFQQEGQNRALIPTDGEQQYFRLTKP